MSIKFVDVAPVGYILEGSSELMYGYVARNSLARLDINNNICVYSYAYNKNYLTCDRWVRVGDIIMVDGMDEFVPIMYYSKEFFKSEASDKTVNAYIRRTQVICSTTSNDYIMLYDRIKRDTKDDVKFQYTFTETGCKMILGKLPVFVHGSWASCYKLLETDSSEDDTSTNNNNECDDGKSQPDDLIGFYISNKDNEYEKVNVSRREVKEVAETIRLSDTPANGFKVSGYDDEGNRYGSVEVKLNLANEAVEMKLIMDTRDYSSSKVKVIMHNEQSSECIVRFVRKGQLDHIFKKDLSYFELNDEDIDIYKDEEAEDPIKTVSLKDIEIDPNYMGQEMLDVFNSVINKEDQEMGYMYLYFEKKDGTMQRIFLNDDYKILRGFTEHMAPTFMSIKAWVEIPNTPKAYKTVDYRVEFSFGDFSKHREEHHVTFNGVPRRHIRKLIIINVRTGNAEYIYEEGYGLSEPILFRNQFGRPVITCTTPEVKLNTTSRPTAEDKSKDEYIKIYVKLENGDYIPLYINANSIRRISNYKCSLNAIDVAGYTEIPVTAEDRGDYRVELKLTKDRGKYRILSVDVTKVDYDSKPEQPLDTLIQVFYKVVDTVGNIGWGVNPIHQEKAKSGYVMKDKLDEILSKPDLEDMNNSYVSIFGRENDDPNAPLRHIATRRLCEIAIIPAYLYDSLNSLFDDGSNKADTPANNSCGCVSGGCENCDCDSECGTCSDPKQKEDNKDDDDDSQCDYDCNNFVASNIL